MTDQEYRAAKARIKRYLDKWFKAAGFSWWRVNITYHREVKDDAEYSAVADTTTHWEYRQAYINFYVPQFEGKTDEEVERVVVHELSHILIASTSNFSTDEDRQMTEYATECVTQALLYSHSHVKRDAKK